jgi:hypothetical protein
MSKEFTDTEIAELNKEFDKGNAFSEVYCGEGMPYTLLQSDY